MDMNNVHNCFSFDVRALNFPSAAVSNHTPKKNRTKFLRLDGPSKPKPKPAGKPDPTAPKITRPCTECGKKFWSWKALFGHMRCHPERQWRGINPPSNFRPPPEITSSSYTAGEDDLEDDHEVAACLLILANQGMLTEYSNSGSGSSGRFECSSCNKVFSSHRALGGHRASHKNVKGCYANTKKDEEEGCCVVGTDQVSLGYKCSVCFRVFSSGQALGGHKRCHWEKNASTSGVCGLDLNLPFAPLIQDEYDHDDSSSYSSRIPTLDLRLGL